MPRARATNTRTDTMTPKLPAGTVQKDQAYGNRTAQEQSLAMLPLGGQTPPAAAPAATPGTPSGAPNQAAAAGGPTPRPGELPWLQPTNHGLPVTTGRPYGPGAGPEALTGPAAQWHAQQSTEQGTLQTLLKGMAQVPGASSIVKSLAQAAGAGG
jgi:hypothetical protein